jgi:hypothetical protein
VEREEREEEGRGKREEGRGKREEGRGKREEGRRKREEGRGKREKEKESGMRGQRGEVGGGGRGRKKTFAVHDSKHIFVCEPEPCQHHVLPKKRVRAKKTKLHSKTQHSTKNQKKKINAINFGEKKHVRVKLQKKKGSKYLIGRDPA